MPWRTAWVLRVTTNLVIDLRRTGSIRGQQVAEVPGPEETVVLRQALVSALSTLSRRQRETVVLRHLSQLPEQDVAAALGISVGSVKTHLHRGLRQLRSVLETDDQDVALCE